MKCRYLDGENIAPRNVEQARKLLNIRVEYLLSYDIDKSGRGYFFPRKGKITSVLRRNVEFDGTQNWVSTSSIVEMREL